MLISSQADVPYKVDGEFKALLLMVLTHIFSLRNLVTQYFMYTLTLVEEIFSV